MSEIILVESTPLAVEVLSDGFVTDDQAVAAFLGGYERRARNGGSRHTLASYRLEIGRFLLWLRGTRGNLPCLLPRVTQADILEYQDFIADPRPFNEEFLKTHGWDHQPFKGPLGHTSMDHALVILNKMFAAMRDYRAPGDKPFCAFNPCTSAREGVRSLVRSSTVEQALTAIEWEAVQSTIEALPRETGRDRAHYHRARWLTQLFYRTFLRREEVSKLTMGAFRPYRSGWVLDLVGKGGRAATIQAPSKLIAELKVYRQSHGLPPLPSPGETRPAVMAVTGKDKPLTPAAIYTLCKQIFGRAADRIRAEDPHAASRLRQASPHWLRHTGISHAMEADIDPRRVQAQARHSSLTITARYDHKDHDAWARDMERL